MTRYLLVAALAAALAGCGAHSKNAAPKVNADRSKIAVYVFTQPPATRLVTIDEHARGVDTSELARHLRGKKHLVLVESPQQADVVVELLSPVQLFRPHQEQRFDDRELIADLTAAGKTTRLTASRGDVGRTVYTLAKRVDKWIADNRASIVAARGK